VAAAGRLDPIRFRALSVATRLATVELAETVD
jgi:hypothetical protein